MFGFTLRHYDETKTLLKSQHQFGDIGADGEQQMLLSLKLVFDLSDVRETNRFISQPTLHRQNHARRRESQWRPALFLEKAGSCR